MVSKKINIKPTAENVSKFINFKIEGTNWKKRTPLISAKENVFAKSINKKKIKRKIIKEITTRNHFKKTNPFIL